MMKVLFSPQVRENEKIIYEFTDTTVKATHKGITDIFDFTDLPDGELQIYDDETGEELIETELENPIRSARKENGVLHVKLMNYIGTDASYEECFPEWIDHEDCVAPDLPDVPEEPVTEEYPVKEELSEEDVNISTEVTTEEGDPIGKNGMEK